MSAPDTILPGRLGVYSTRSGLARTELWLAALAVFLAPINILRLQNVYLTASDLVVALCLVLLLVRPLVLGARLRSVPRLYGLGLLIMLAALLLSSIIRGDMIRGLVGITQYLFAYGVLPLIFLRATPEEALLLAKTFLVAILVICLHGFWLSTLEPPYDPRFMSGSGRLRGMVERENALGVLIATTVPLVVWMMRRAVMPVWFGLLCLGVMLYTVMLTGSNTGLFSFVLAGVMMQLASPKPLQDSLILVAVLVCLGALFMAFGEALLPEIFVRRVYGAISTGDMSQAGTVMGRLALNFEALRIAHENLLIGQGMDQYREASVYGAPVHNAYLLLLNEGSVFALVGWMMMYLGVLTVGLSLLTQRSSRVTGFYLLVSFAIFATAISATTHVYGRFWIVPWLVALGIAVAENRTLQKPFPAAAQRLQFVLSR